MKKCLLYVFSVGTLFSYERGYAQEQFSAGAVVSMKANYYKDYVYTSENDGVPSKDVQAYSLNITPTSWGLAEAGITGQTFPMNSLTPTEITTKRGNTIVLNGKDPDGTEHNFQAAPLELSSGNVGLVKGYGITENIVNYKPKADEIKQGKRADWFLTSGRHGMDLSTGVANIARNAKINFGTVLIDKDKIADDKPDFLFTQIAGPQSNPLDQMYFVDAQGAKVGKSIFVNFASNDIPDLGSPQRYIQYNDGAGPKPLKLLSFEIKDLGIDENNYGDVVGLVYIPSGNSDPAFLAADRKSIFVFKDVGATMDIKGDNIEEKEGNYIVEKGDKTTKIVLKGYSQNGSGPYEFTYEVTDASGMKQQVTVTSDTSELEISVPTSEEGTFTYKLIKVKDTGNNTEKEIKNEEITIIIAPVVVCTAPPRTDGVAGDTFVAISTMKKEVTNKNLPLEGLGAYIALESTTKGFVITRNANPEDNIKPAKLGMLVWDTTAKCLKLYSDKGGNLQWHCIEKGCNINK